MGLCRDPEQLVGMLLGQVGKDRPPERPIGADPL